MKELAKRATTIRPIVPQSNREAWKMLKHGTPSIQVAKTFSDNLEEFHELERQYNCLFTDMQFLTDTANIPEFPPSLTTDEISSKSYVEQVLKRGELWEVKALQFTVEGSGGFSLRMFSFNSSQEQGVRYPFYSLYCAEASCSEVHLLVSILSFAEINCKPTITLQ